MSKAEVGQIILDAYTKFLIPPMPRHQLDVLAVRLEPCDSYRRGAWTPDVWPMFLPFLEDRLCENCTLPKSSHGRQRGKEAST